VPLEAFQEQKWFYLYFAFKKMMHQTSLLIYNSRIATNRFIRCAAILLFQLGPYTSQGNKLRTQEISQRVAAAERSSMELSPANTIGVHDGRRPVFSARSWSHVKGHTIQSSPSSESRYWVDTSSNCSCRQPFYAQYEITTRLADY
jgi:hypothetical protein